MTSSFLTTLTVEFNMLIEDISLHNFFWDLPPKCQAESSITGLTSWRTWRYVSFVSLCLGSTARVSS